MKNPIAAFGTLIVAVLAIFVGSQALFVVGQTQRALVLTFGNSSDRVYGPGLHFKWPVAQSVIYLDNRILDVETSKQEVLASDNKIGRAHV